MDVISCEYKYIYINCNKEILDRNNIRSLMKEVSKSLNRIVEKTNNYSNVLSYACEEYRKAEVEIERLYHLYQCDEGNNKVNKLSSTSQDKGIINFYIMKNIKPCPLPEKNHITVATVKKGTIEEGKNILIRTWKV